MMQYTKDQSGTSEPAIRLQIVGRRVVGSGNFEDNFNGSFFEPREPSEATPGESRGRSTIYNAFAAPEKRLTLFALRLAVVEKAASGLGKLAFIWATVVLLGGFASALRTLDFWLVTLILLTEGTRIFSRSHELEWQHHTTWSLTGASRYSFRAIISSSRVLVRAIKAIFQPLWAIRSRGRHIANDIKAIHSPQNHALSYATTHRSSNVPLFPHPGWFFISKNISRVLNWLQVLSSLTCMVLSLMRLIQQDFGNSSQGDQNQEDNQKSALNIFYGLALAEALMFLLEKAYWEWMVTGCKILEKVRKDCELSPSDAVSVRRFFYDAYSSCINGSIFDGLKMDLVSFAEELLDSDSHDEQLCGAKILNKFVKSRVFSAETLRKIGTSPAVITRLINMLSWKKAEEEEIRQSAAEIISKLAGRKQKALHVATISGAMESISSLLNARKNIDTNPYETSYKNNVPDNDNYDFSVFNLLGLRILKKLAHDHDNCSKIGSARGLLAKIIDFTSSGERMLRNELITESQINLVTRSLKLLKILASTTGHTGKILRQEIAENVFTVSNIRDILEYGENHMMLQKLAMEVLTGLTMDEGAREIIGSTGGMIKLLVRIFFEPGLTEEQNSVRNEAGESLAMLALENEKNCQRILKEKDVLQKFVEALKDPIIFINSSRTLRNICTYNRNEKFKSLQGVTAAIPTLLHAIMTKEKKQLEVAIGLGAEVFRFTSPDEYDHELQIAGITHAAFAEKMLRILKEYRYPNIKVPRMRRYVLLLVIWVMKSQPNYIEIFKKLSIEEVIRGISETTSELECFNVFSGAVGLSRHKSSVNSLVDTALDLLEER